MKTQLFAATASAATLSLLLVGAGFAQETTPGTDPGAAPPEAPAATAPQEPAASEPAIGQADRESATISEQQQGGSVDEAAYMISELMDKDVRNAQDEELGKVQNLLVSADGRITHAVVGAGGVLGVGQDMYAVPWDRLQFSPDQEHVVLNVPQDQLSTEFSAFEEAQLKGGGAQSPGESAGGDVPEAQPEVAPEAGEPAAEQPPAAQ